MNSLRASIQSVYHGLAMALLALIMGALWAAYIATHHEQLHGGFEAQEASIEKLEMQHHKQELDMTGMNMDHAHADSAAPHAHPDSSESHQDNHSDSSATADVHQHSHSGSLATDAMQRLLRGHIHFMGVGIMVIVMLILVASTSLKSCWQKVFGWTFGLGTLMYPPAWILMGFRTVELGPEAAEESVLWLFGPAVALLIGSLIALFAVMAIEYLGLNKRRLFSWAFVQ
ncbi:MAG: hypothetical protein Q9M31_08935 [Mariprofundus sp.]|nr:hypothetical protein [Mariprofundus sp.]